MSTLFLYMFVCLCDFLAFETLDLVAFWLNYFIIFAFLFALPSSLLSVCLFLFPISI